MAIIPDEFGLLRHANNLDARAEQFRRLYGNMLMYGEGHAQADGCTADALRSAAKLIDSLLSDRARNAALVSEAVAGWKLVPVEPTDKMLYAADGWTDLVDGGGENSAASRREEFRLAWKVMLEAVRTPTQEKPERHEAPDAVLTRKLSQYEGCTPEAVAGGSMAQMRAFVADAKRDIATLAAALEAERKKARHGTTPAGQLESTGGGADPSMITTAERKTQ